MTVLSIASVYLRRLARDRTAMFFVVVLPVVVILVVGASVGGFDTFRVGLIDAGDGPLAQSLVRDIRHSSALDVRTFSDEDALRTAVRRSEVAAGIVVPAGVERALASGRDATIPVIGEQANTDTQAVYSTIASIVTAHGARVQAARFATEHAGGTFTENVDRATTMAEQVPAITVRDVRADTERRFLPDGFSYSAPTMLTLFVFINALALGAVAIENRRLGLYERFLAAPVRPSAIVLGEVTGAFSMSLLQSLLIIGVGAAVFGVHWGDPAAAAVLVVVWALVGTGAGMLSGSLFRTPEQASSIGPALGIAFGMLGGCMWPLEIVGPVMRTVGHVVPHAWAVDAWVELLSRGGNLSDIVRQLLVLAAFAAGLLLLASYRLRRTLVR
jgi:ABC-2 type transport system permease protein